MRIRQALSVTAAAVACLGASSVLAEEETKPVNANEIVTTVCAMCHGEDGNKMLTPETPKIGGQKRDYLAKALHDYKSGARTNAIMASVAQPLSEAEIEALARYYSTQSSELYTLK